MRAEIEPRRLLEIAEGLLHRGDPATVGLWPRVSALLAFQALDAALRRLWELHGLDLHGCSVRTQLICLPTYLGDPGLAARTAHASSALRRACHHHPYELAPTAGELQDWLSAVGELVQHVASSPESSP